MSKAIHLPSRVVTRSIALPRPMNASSRDRSNGPAGDGLDCHLWLEGTNGPKEMSTETAKIAPGVLAPGGCEDTMPTIAGHCSNPANRP